MSHSQANVYKRMVFPLRRGQTQNLAVSEGPIVKVTRLTSLMALSFRMFGASPSAAPPVRIFTPLSESQALRTVAILFWAYPI